MVALVNTADKQFIEDVMYKSHSIDYRLKVSKLNGTNESISYNTIVEGQIDVDTTAAVTRSASITIVDTSEEWVLPKSIVGVAGLDKQITIEQCFEKDGRSVWIPLFTGPVFSVDRDGALAIITAHGKESIAQRPFWKVQAWGPGAYGNNVIKDVMAATGETLIADMTQGSARMLGTEAHLTKFDVPWAFCKEIARQNYFSLTYDAGGRMCLQPKNNNIVHTFSDYQPFASLLSKPKIVKDTNTLVNTVAVTARTTPGAEQPSFASIDAGPASTRPIMISRGQFQLRYPEIFSLDKEATQDELTEKLMYESDAVSAVTGTASFDSLVNPLLEEGDVIRLQCGNLNEVLRPTKWSIGLGSGATMTVEALPLK